jgi:hypothetical protein
MRGLGNAEAHTFAVSYPRARLVRNMSSDGRNLDLFALELRVHSSFSTPVARQVWTWHYRCNICDTPSHRNVCSRSDRSISRVFANGNRCLYFSLCHHRSHRPIEIFLERPRVVASSEFTEQLDINNLPTQPYQGIFHHNFFQGTQ